MSPSPIVFCVVYIPPSSSEGTWLSLLDYLHSLFTSVDVPIFVVGDFNCPDINWQLLSAPSKFSSLLCDLIFDLQLTQCVELPTHLKGNILDLIITNSVNRISDVVVHQNQFTTSDHFLISFLALTALPKISHHHPLTFLNYDKADYKGMCDFLMDWDFSNCLDSSTVEVIWSDIKDAITTAISRFVPTFTTTHRHAHLPKWFNQQLRHNLKCLRTLRRKHISNPTQYRLNKLNNLEAQLHADIAQAKMNYESKLVHDFACNKNPKLYSHIRSVTRQNHLPQQLTLDHRIATTDEEKANLFNEYFFSVYSTHSSFTAPPCSHPPSSITEVDISVTEVYQALSNLDPSKAMGIDGISPKVLKFCAVALCEPLHHLFRTSLLTSHIPSEWRLHCITPIFKSGERTSISNYRPVSLLCSVSKVLERLIYDKVIDQLSSSFSSAQFGFLRGRSTLQQLLVFLHTIHDNMNNKLQTDVVYLDLRKAFDTVPHDKLLTKLWSMGVTDRIWLWFSAYLTSRFQCVRINGHLSGHLPVTSGVPQGSILGPLLFLIFINDLPSVVTSAKLLLYADDTKCIKSLSNQSDSLKLQNDLDSLYQWSVSNISFNLVKTILLRFSPHQSPFPTDYFLDNQLIVHSDSCRDLGVTLSQNLSWSKHISNIVSKAYKILGLIRRTFNSSTPTGVRKTLYLSLVRSQLTYCCPVWRPHLLKDILLLEKVQRRATKWILNDYRSDYKTRLISLHMLPLMMVYELCDLSFFLKSLSSPSNSFNIRNYITFSSSSTRSLGYKLQHHFARTNTSRHFFFNRLPRLWNSLPNLNLLNVSPSQGVLSLKQFYWSHFITHFNSSNPCNYHFRCPCNKCILS